MSRIAEIHAFALRGLPLFQPGMAIAREIGAAIDRAGEVLRPGDVCVIAQKIVSKCEGRRVALADVAVGAEARALAAKTSREAALLQLILDESSEILRATPAAVIARHRTGHVLANAGIDASNVEGGDAGSVLLWPVDPDASARAIRAGIGEVAGVRPAVVIADSMGRAWRIGTVGTAIGCAGIAAVEDRRGTGQDLFGRTLQATVIAIADSLAATAALVMGEGDEGTPVAILRGCERWVTAADGPGAAGGLRPVAEDMFR
ncbi:coenzyme F420-0:L-glutamate ligase [Novosphingobium album (ex Liu et al. 2023)]|uniref:Coenzyme F420-0:L-glutamate ligase n=1 Tax=Novosphingobium album (ex Liu et al. 2023) TaxID=3031130 RepID=A0ABT5WUB4_9SPHN|nr:coenzyme F420-0:L-glutamate ligase [Novosphingobium album (ex Liu et al. 2023)]MDE8653495.1 coenzyme F420-0:L-glutamate ligase [Novosphingobium album (ex Liu et al. 2023)]